MYSYCCESGGSRLCLFFCIFVLGENWGVFVFLYFCESGGSHLCLSPASATGLTTTCWSMTHPAQPFFWNISNIDLEDNNIWNIDQQSTYWSTTPLAQPFFSINTNIDLKYSRYFTTFKIHLVCWSTFIFKYSKHQKNTPLSYQLSKILIKNNVMKVYCERIAPNVAFFFWWFQMTHLEMEICWKFWTIVNILSCIGRRGQFIKDSRDRETESGKKVWPLHLPGYHE